MKTGRFGVFGSNVRTKTLVAIAVLDGTDVPELSGILGARTNVVRYAIETLDQAGLVMGALEGNTRRIWLNTKYPAYAQLRELLVKLALDDAPLLAFIADFEL